MFSGSIDKIEWIDSIHFKRIHHSKWLINIHWLPISVTPLVALTIRQNPAIFYYLRDKDRIVF
jgi:hypothetical protein